MAFDKILEFERALAEYTGAPYAIMTDCCTHAIELCLRYEQPKHVLFTPYTYLSVPMTMHKLGIPFEYLDSNDRWVGEYHFVGSCVWDSARRLERDMYRPKQMQCLSFGHSKPLQIGHGGAILLDNKEAYETLLRMRYDGRDLTFSPWEEQKTFAVGYHYRPTIEDAGVGITLLNEYKTNNNTSPIYIQYPDCRTINITD